MNTVPADGTTPPEHTQVAAGSGAIKKPPAQINATARLTEITRQIGFKVCETAINEGDRNSTGRVGEAGAPHTIRR
jgi:hypothetical protein